MVTVDWLASWLRGPYLQLPQRCKLLNQCKDGLREARIGNSWFGAPGAIRLPSQSVMPGCVMCQSTCLLRTGSDVEAAPSSHLVSMQLEGHDEQPVDGLIKAGVLEQPLRSPDWLQTAEVLAISRLARQR